MADYLYADEDLEGSTWTSAPLYAKIDEEPYSDYDLISTSTNGAYAYLGLQSGTDPGIHTGHWMHVRAKNGDGDPDNRVFCQLLQGKVEICGFYAGSTSSFVTTDYELTTAEASDITDYTALELMFTAVTDGADLQVSWARVDIPEIVTGTAAMAPDGSLSSVGTLLRLAAAALTGAGSLVASGESFTPAVLGQAALAVAGSVEGAAQLLVFAAAALEGQLGLLVETEVLKLAQATLLLDGAVGAIGSRIATGAVSLAPSLEVNDFWAYIYREPMMAARFFDGVRIVLREFEERDTRRDRR